VVATEAIRNMERETSSTDFDFQVFITCGRKVIQESMPAEMPITSGFIAKIYLMEFHRFS
jgi:hypothetical protein